MCFSCLSLCLLWVLLVIFFYKSVTVVIVSFLIFRFFVIFGILLSISVKRDIEMCFICCVCRYGGAVFATLLNLFAE